MAFECHAYFPYINQNFWACTSFEHILCLVLERSEKALAFFNKS
jgi:hypothetical protein